MSDLLQDPTDQRWVFLVAMPILHRGTVRGTLAAEVQAQTLSDVRRRQQTPLNGVVTLIGERNEARLAVTGSPSACRSWRGRPVTPARKDPGPQAVPAVVTSRLRRIDGRR